MPEHKSGFRENFRPVIAWVGIVCTAVTVFGALQAVLEMADWARFIVSHWTEWTRAFWGWTLGWIGLRVPDPFVPFLTATAFYSMLAIDSASRERPPENPPQIALLGGLGTTLCMGLLLVPAMNDIIFPSAQEINDLSFEQLDKLIDRNITSFLAAVIVLAIVCFALLGILRACGFWIGYFSWRPAIIGMMVMLLLSLNELSKLELAPLLKAPKV